MVWTHSGMFTFVARLQQMIEKQEQAIAHTLKEVLRYQGVEKSFVASKQDVAYSRIFQVLAHVSKISKSVAEGE